MINFEVRILPRRKLLSEFDSKNIFQDLVDFELWDQDPFFMANENLDSAISIAGSHWLGSGFIC